MPKNNAVTKDYLDKRLEEFGDKLKKELKEDLYDIKDELKKELKEDLKEELYDIKDEIVGEIKSMREDFDTHQFSHQRINDELSELSEGVKTIKTQVASQA